MTRLGDLLVKNGSVSREAIDAAVVASKTGGRKLGEVLLEGGAVDERELYRAIAERSGVPFADADTIFPRIDAALGKHWPKKFASRVRAVPVFLDESGTGICVATADPNVDLREISQALDNRPVRLLVVTPTDLERVRGAVDLAQAQHAPVEKKQRGIDLLDAGRFDTELVALFDALLLDAVAQRASDLHIEIYGDVPRVRFRIDGDLHDAPRYRLTKEQHAGILNVLKVSSDLDISEHRLPQGGRFSARAGDRVFDLRVQTQPALHGEHAVLRLLPQGERLLTIADLGLSPPLAASYERLMRVPAGLVLIVGPTGSGKSTTLYAGLQLLARDATRKVISVEDPIEYAIDGIQQVAARAELGFGFAQAMRAFVREDPDVILVGEIRDAETALEAIRASQTGHLVLSTLHCNDAVDAIQRLRDLGMHRNSIASELLAVFAQRLAKRVCPACRAAAALEDGLAREVFPHGIPDGFIAFRGAGCGRCSGLGTLGRIAVVEHLPTGATMRTAISRDTPVDELREVAKTSGLEPMRMQALQLVRDGVIPFDELRWLLPPERLADDEHDT